MTTATARAHRNLTRLRDGRAGVLLVLWTVIVRSVATRVRLAGLGTLGLAAILLGASVRLSGAGDRPGAAWSLLDTYGLSLLVPVVALFFASAALGDLAEDGTLVYLWLRPLPRWILALAALGASVSIVSVVAVLPLVVGVAATGQGGRLVGAAAAGGMLASVAYSSVFCGLGLRVRRALAWGLAYLLIWEQAVSRVSHGAARASLFMSTRSLAAFIAGRPAPHNAVAWETGLAFPLAVSLVAMALTARSLGRGEIA